MSTTMHNPAILPTNRFNFEQLEVNILGELIRPGDTAYDEVRRVMLITIDRHPLAIVRALTAHDVASTVMFACENNIPIAVRGGGHSLAGHSMADDALVIDLALMKDIAIDPATGIANVGAGVTSGELAGPAAAHGFALSTGDTASVGFGGLATGGGIGFMVRKYGLAIDNLVAAQVVTATGEILTASADEHPNLFWAIRGGGGNFGIVTSFTFRLAPVGPLIVGGALFLPATRAVVRGYLDYAVTAPDDLTTIANLMSAPPAPFVPQEWIGKPVLAILLCWTGEQEAGERALAPLRALATPIADVVGPMPYPALYNFTAPQSAPHGAAIRSMFADELDDMAIDTAIAAIHGVTSPFSVIQFRGLGGAMARVDAAATAFAHRERRYLVAIIGAWLDSAEDATRHREWVESLWCAVRHAGIGAYANFLADEGTNRIGEAYPTATHARLASLKAQYDPENIFRLNQNIAPSAATLACRAAMRAVGQERDR